MYYSHSSLYCLFTPATPCTDSNTTIKIVYAIIGPMFSFSTRCSYNVARTMHEIEREKNACGSQRVLSWDESGLTKAPYSIHTIIMANHSNSQWKARRVGWHLCFVCLCVCVRLFVWSYKIQVFVCTNLAHLLRCGGLIFHHTAADTCIGSQNI